MLHESFERQEQRRAKWDKEYEKARRVLGPGKDEKSVEGKKNGEEP